MQKKREYRNPKIKRIIKMAVVAFAGNTYDAHNLGEILDRIEFVFNVRFETLMPESSLCRCDCGCGKTFTTRKAKLAYLTSVLRDEREDYGVRAFACKGRGKGWFHVFGKLHLATRLENPLYSEKEIVALLDSVRDVHGITIHTAQGKQNGIDLLIADVKNHRVFAPVLPFEELFDIAA